MEEEEEEEQEGREPTSQTDTICASDVSFSDSFFDDCEEPTAELAAVFRRAVATAAAWTASRCAAAAADTAVEAGEGTANEPAAHLYVYL